MDLKRILIASRDLRLLSRLDHRLRPAYVVEMALTSGEALSKLQSKWYSAALVDQTLIGPGEMEIGRRLSPGMHVVSVCPEDVWRVDEVVEYLQAIDQPGDVVAAVGVG